MKQKIVFNVREGGDIIFSVFTFVTELLIAEDEQIDKKKGSQYDLAFLRYCAPKSEVYL